MFNLGLIVMHALQLATQPAMTVVPPPPPSSVDALRERFRKYKAWQANRHSAKKPH